MRVVIIGNGISGVTAARFIRKRDADAEITIVSKESKHFFSRTALMYIYMGHMRYEDTKPYEDHFWSKNRIALVQDEVQSVAFQSKTLQLSNSQLEYDVLILATGSKPNYFGWPGQDLKGVKGLYSLQDLAYLEKYTDQIDNAVLVGGGLIGVELAEMLLSRGKKVTFLVREDRFWAKVLSEPEAKMIENHMVNDHHVSLKRGSNLGEILGDAEGKVKGVIVKENEEQLPCEYVGLTAGVSPNIDFLKETELELDRGILVDSFLRTNIQDVYAIGDCAQFREPLAGRAPIEQVWYTGRMMGETLAKTICIEPTPYQPGPWFNSAKFFDIEYQTYGAAPVDLPEGVADFYWQHETENIAVRILYHQKTFEFIGINTFGMRMRHACFDQWLREKERVDFVMEHLNDALFDPEFYKNHLQELTQAFSKESGLNLRVKKKSWKRLLQFSK